jgi:hypothetical protein
MNNLSPRDTLLVIILINVLCYWLGWQFICSPLIKTYKSTREQYYVQCEERDRLQTEVNNFPTYKNTVEEREKEKNEILESRFYPTVYSEVFHKWVFDQGQNSISDKITSFSIEPKVATTTNENGEMEELDFVDNSIQISFESSYEEALDFLKKIESKDIKVTDKEEKTVDQKGKSAALTNVSITPSASVSVAAPQAPAEVVTTDGAAVPVPVVSSAPSGTVLQVDLTYSFYSISKEANRMEKNLKIIFK